MTAAKETGADKRTLELVKMRDILEELASKTGRDALVDVVMGVLLNAEKVIEDQAVEIQQLKKQLFGRRSEKISPDQMSLFVQVVGAIVAKSDAASTAERSDEEPTEPEKKKKKRNAGRRPLTPTQSHEIVIPEDERPCPECGEAPCTIGHVRSLVIEYTPPKVDVIEYKREKIACRSCESEVVVAPPPAERMIDRALPGPNMLSALTVNKGVDGLPLNRTQKIFRRSGLDISIQTLNRWEGFAHQLLDPVIQVVRRAVLDADTINLDDTGLRVRDQSVKRGTVRGHIWVFVGRKYDPGGDLQKTREFVFYLYAPDWKAEHPENFLANCSAVLQGDAYRGYERIASPNLGDKVGRLLAGCCMHARRPFVQALEAKDPSSVFFIERFQSVYRIEEKARRDALTASERLLLRKQESLPILEEIRGRAEELQSLPLAKPMQMGVTYLINQWEKLVVPFTTDGRLEIDNGSAERRLRRVASGRKSWLFAGSKGGAERFADVLSLVSTAEAASVDPGSYIANILSRIDTWPNQRIGDLLPHRWRAALEESAEERPTAQLVTQT